MLIVVKLLLGSLATHFTFVGTSINGAVRREVIWGLGCDLLIYAIPYRVNALFIIKALKDTIATDHEEIKVVL